MEPATKADIEAVLERTDAILAVLLEEFPDNPAVARRADRFIDSLLDPSRVDAD